MAGTGGSESSNFEETLESASHAGTSPRAEAGLDLESGQSVGRYVILARLGAGAMGVVYSAYDPELDRRVAVKLLQTRGSGAEVARTRLQREAQALARVSHPNVVAVHDVGVAGAQLFVAMEYVDGVTLNSVLAEGPMPRSRAIELFTAAAAGLAAAHAEGLVHRDFKPENVMLDARNRVRVLDFGLARAQGAEGDATIDARPNDPLSDDSATGSRSSFDSRLTRTGAVLGTPAYMAPEQHLGLPADARSDQFAFCVALYEALYGERPFHGNTLALLAMAVAAGQIGDPPAGSGVPSWLRRVLMRGLSTDPGDRYPDMPALIRAMHDDPAIRRRRFGVGTAGVGLVAGAVWLGRSGAPVKTDRCAAASTALAEVWSAEARVQVIASIQNTKASFADDTANRVADRLDTYASEWTALRRDACEATHVRGEQSADLLDRRMACLDRRSDALAELTGVLGEATVDVAAEALHAVDRLPPLGRCSDDEALLAAIPASEDPTIRAKVDELRRRLARASALEAAGRYSDGLALAERLWAEARPIDYRPLHAEVSYQVARFHDRLGDQERASETFRRTERLAVAAGDDAIAARASAAAAHVIGFQQREVEAGQQWGLRADAFAEAAGRPAAVWADVLDHRGFVARAANEFEESARLHREAAAVNEAEHGAEHMDVVRSLKNLANTLSEASKYDEALEVIERAVAASESALGAGHPRTADASGVLARVLHRQEKFERALTVQAGVVDTLVRALGENHVEVGDARLNYSTMLQAAGRVDEAKQQLVQSKDAYENAPGDYEHKTALAVNGLAIVSYMEGDLPAALEGMARAIEIIKRTRGSDDPEIINMSINYAGLLSNAGRSAEALSVAHEVVAHTQNMYGHAHLEVAYAIQRRAQIQFRLEQPDEAAADYRRAIDILEQLHDEGHSSTAASWTGLSDVALMRGDEATAIRNLEKALRVMGDHDEYRARRGKASLQLLRLLGHDPALRKRVDELLESARADLAAVGPSAADALAELEAYAAKRR